MNRFIIALLSVVLCAWAASAVDVWYSSFTATADTTKNVCMDKRGVLHGVVVSSSATGGFIVYSSSAVAVNKLAEVDTTVKGAYYYDVFASTNTGLTYSKTGTATVTMMYSCH